MFPQALGLSVLIFSVLLLSRRPPALTVPAYLLAAFMAASGSLGPEIWNLTFSDASTGLPVFSPFNPQSAAIARRVFVIASLGPFLVGALVHFLSIRQRRSPSRADLGHFAQQVPVAPSLIFSGVVLLSWVAGQGSAAWSSSTYLGANGPTVLQHLANPLVPIAVAAAAAAGLSSALRETPRRGHQFVSVCLLIAWWMLLTSKGTRQSAAVPIALGIVIVPLIKDFLLRLLLTVAAVWTSLATLQIALIARSAPHGLRNLSAMAFDSRSVGPLGDASLWEPIAFLGKNLSGFVLVTALSVRRAPDAGVLVANLNPLPRALGGGADSFGVERLWPYEWVPLSTIGEIYGAWGAFELFLLMSSLALIAVVAASGMGQGRTRTALSIAAIAITPLLAMFLVQYSSRNAFRAAWLLVGIAVAQMVVTLARTRRYKLEGNHREDSTQPRLSD